MGECRGCRWWDQDKAAALLRVALPLVGGVCTGVDQPDSRALLTLSAAQLNPDGSVKSNAELLTQPDFGCTQYQAKEL